MEFFFTATSQVIMNHRKGETKSQHVATNVNIECSKNLDQRKYLNKDGLPTADGAKSMTIAFVHGLIGNIHHCHQLGYRDSAEHLRWIIAELEKGFATVANTEQSTFEG